MTHRFAFLFCSVLFCSHRFSRLYLQACVVESREMVDKAWDVMDKVLVDSFYKCVLRAFSWYLLRRHY